MQYPKTIIRLKIKSKPLPINSILMYFHLMATGAMELLEQIITLITKPALVQITNTQPANGR